ncbi:hypothetical protein JOB18_027211 [Solea senegalensis]|uniref:Uncharacterized protein n=1 Tax=Solea senegalensis TaxID=28829 RepID=A0AAV6SPA8_SOLSE|nr:hypothetical protein JOB18_027211 [Solea senegalensis]
MWTSSCVQGRRHTQNHLWCKQTKKTWILMFVDAVTAAAQTALTAAHNKLLSRLCHLLPINAARGAFQQTSIPQICRHQLARRRDTGWERRRARTATLPTPAFTRSRSSSLMI